MGTPSLLIYNPINQRWEHFPLTRESYSVGRDPKNDLVINDAQVSRQHAFLHLDQKGVWISALDTPNGVLINDTRIQAGQWTLIPEGATLSFGQYKIRLEQVPQKAPQSQAPARQPLKPAPKTAKKNSWLWLAAAGVILLVCIGVGIGGVLLLKPQAASVIQGPTAQTQGQIQEPAAVPTQELVSPPVSVESLPITSGNEVADGHGVKLAIPASALEAGQSATLESASFSTGMQQELEEAYQIESLAYSVTSANQDGTGKAILSLPAPSPDSRLAVLIDNKYLGVLDIEPQNNVLQINPFLGAPLSESSAPTDTVFTASNRYFVVTPNTGDASRPDNNLQLVSLHPQTEDTDGKSCITEFWLQSHCWRNPESTVYVFWESNVPEALKDTEYLRIIDMIGAVSEIMRAYSQDYHFSNAAISKSNPVYIIIDPSETEPTYSQKTGNIYLNWGVVGTITSQENHCALAHELMHWTEDTAYVMNVAALSNPKAWWLEMAAENGSFLIDPGCIDRNLTTYGRAVTNDGLLPLQSASLVWNRKEGARYIQALQVYISLCEGGANCAMSQEQFAAAINGGTYPFDDAGVLAAYQRSAKDMGLFLSGQPPAEARADAHIIPSTKEGGAFAEYIWMKAVPDPKMEASDNGKQIQSTGSLQASVTANIAQGGVYPLWVSNGKGSPGNPREGYTSLPGLLQVDAGTKFWYSLDSGTPVFHDGSKELTLGPLSDRLGTGLVKLVAIAPEAPATLNAKIKPVDLSGDWMATLTNPAENLINCPSATDENEDGFQTEGAKQLDFMTIFSMYGTYALDPAVSDGSHLIWEGTFPEGVFAESDITIKPDSIEVKYHFDIPKPESGGAFLAWLWPDTGNPILATGLPNSLSTNTLLNQDALWMIGILAAVILLVMAFQARIHLGFEKRLAFLPMLPRTVRVVALALVILSCTLWLSGCFGMNFWGTIDGKVTFNKLEYIDPATPPAALVPGGDVVEGLAWKLHDGLVENNLDLFIEVSTDNLDGTETTEVEECKFSVTSPADGFIGPTDMVPMPEGGD